ncbi:hypothetical protein I6A84_15455 [Frankia sp. CNm7]|uniref:Uncharacterized protein n=1 Tax=Frankia nepalensis TaxID=1836974 RepID=A0A937UVA1_9ACTN|nr:hypothetical protein [Frankia nepalensis]MBL7499066.1 hypothetical protein [Frankia nepalensis]MBL7508960.1 hypothetical protein [Frankia nepalensis]MBL7519459.1 hypothetical protein [Frankia nepalensis]MBL7632026.1 hypothetical protein [Frankia nepalensis]
MKKIHDYIVEHQWRFGGHPFFVRLERPAPLSEILPFPTLLTFWVMGFQDALRLNAGMMTEPRFQAMARQHVREDSGHDLWFLRDLELIDGSLPDLRILFGEEHWAAREMTYGLLSDLILAEDDVERTVVVLAIESVSEIFLERIVPYFQGAGVERALRYFATNHSEVEKDHELRDLDTREMLDAIELSPSAEARCRSAVDRCYARFEDLFDRIDKKIEECLAAGGGRYDERAALVRDAARATHRPGREPVGHPAR